MVRSAFRLALIGLTRISADFTPIVKLRGSLFAGRIRQCSALGQAQIFRVFTHRRSLVLTDLPAMMRLYRLTLLSHLKILVGQTLVRILKDSHSVADRQWAEAFMPDQHVLLRTQYLALKEGSTFSLMDLTKR